jgi:hypothetical protein
MILECLSIAEEFLMFFTCGGSVPRGLFGSLLDLDRWSSKHGGSWFADVPQSFAEQNALEF